MDALKSRTTPELWVNYDPDADVLYLALGKPVPATVDEDEEGLAFRFALDDGRPCGVTILGYKSAHWSENVRRLSKIIGGRLHIGNAAVVNALTSVRV